MASKWHIMSCLDGKNPMNIPNFHQKSHLEAILDHSGHPDGKHDA